MIHWCA